MQAKTLKVAVALVLLAGMGGVFYKLSDRRDLSGIGHESVGSERNRRGTIGHSGAHNNKKDKLLRRLHRLEDYHRHLDKTLWSQEKEAQRYGEWMVNLWDRLRSTSEKAIVLAEAEFGKLWLGRPHKRDQMQNGITEVRYTEPSSPLTTSDWSERLLSYYEEGYRLSQTEWRHIRFDPDAGGSASSRISFDLHVRHRARDERIAISGILNITWAYVDSSDACPHPETIRVVDLRLKKRNAKPLFRPKAKWVLSHHDPVPLVGPLIVEDLNGDEWLDIIACAENRIFWNRGDWRWREAPITTTPKRFWYASTLLELTGDQALDLLAAGETGLFLFEGKDHGGFESNGKLVWKAPERLLNPFVLTAGDVDGDGDTDIWLGQYKQPYVAGQMPTPYYDANDGFPAYFLRNGGDCRFEEATVAAGLAEKRLRRTYAASFVDLDDDVDLDLLVVSDFAGVDIYRNNGQGKFTDVTESWVDQPNLFGMGHALADLNRDGRLDLYVTGMTSPVAERLDYLGLGKGLRSDYKTMRPVMSYGNRSYLGAPNGFRQSPWRHDVNDSGWSWGVTAFDVENDGDVDLHVVNGHKSRQSVRDYDWRFWCHDIYAGGSNHSQSKDLFFRSAQRRYFGRGDSHAGYQKNRLFLQRSTEDGFLEASYLMGTALEEDCRSVVSADLDNDGRQDLALMTYQSGPSGEKALHLLRNVAPSRNHWIGFDLGSERVSGNGIGAEVTLVTNHGQQTESRVVGDSFRAQHSGRIHFGLGKERSARRAVVRWIDGTSTVLENPEMDRYHKVR